MPVETADPEQSTEQSSPPAKTATGIAAHLLILVFTITGVAIQLFVPRFVAPLEQLGEHPLPFYTTALIDYQFLILMLSAVFPVAVLFFGWLSRFKMPLSRPIVAVIVAATLLEGATAFALLKPMRGVVEGADGIKPVGEAVGAPGAQK
jgi:hypothetical protein